MRLLTFLTRGFFASVIVATACGGDDSVRFSNVVTIGEDITPIVISSDLSVGKERLSIGLIKDDTPLKNGEVEFSVYKIDGNQGAFRARVKATDIHTSSATNEMHQGGGSETHEAGSLGVYVAEVDFDAPGDWGILVRGKAGGESLKDVQVRFIVQPDEVGIAVGEPAPNSVQAISKDVANLSEVDTSPVPDPAMHMMTIATAVGSGRPTLIAFATPAYCRSAVCGPVKGLVDELFKSYGQGVNFVHVEPYDLAKARTGELEPLPLLENEWRLSTEPWIFVIGKDGRVAAKYESAVSQNEIESALRAVLGVSKGP